MAELQNNGIELSSINKPIDSFIITHYDHDQMGAALPIIPLSKIIYDTGNHQIKDA